MNEQTKAAVNRLSRLKKGEGYFEVYGVRPTGYGHLQRDQQLVLDEIIEEWISKKQEEQP